jgi:hypothetical protein
MLGNLEQYDICGQSDMDYYTLRLVVLETEHG